ncbi:MAG TPA: hypothetical protein VKX16_06845 [Chloroflexota bacterium]|nr:hypothetical protein [Chloroflexota bacterium]
MKALSLLLTGIGAVLLSSGSGMPQVHGAVARSLPVTASGVVQRVALGPAERLVLLRVASGGLVSVPLSQGRVTTQDGWTLPATEVQVGDHLVQVRGGALIDLSQRLVTVDGILAAAPEAGPLLVTLSGTSRTILADMSANIDFRDASGETSEATELEQADVVELRGFLDVPAGEMTRIESIQRLGPQRRA